MFGNKSGWYLGITNGKRFQDALIYIYDAVFMEFLQTKCWYLVVTSMIIMGQVDWKPITIICIKVGRCDVP